MKRLTKTQKLVFGIFSECILKDKPMIKNLLMLPKNTIVSQFIDFVADVNEDRFDDARQASNS